MQDIFIKLVVFRSDHRGQGYSGNKKKKCLLLVLPTQISPGLVSLKYCDYLKVSAFSCTVEILTQVVEDISPLSIFIGYRCGT